MGVCRWISELIARWVILLVTLKFGNGNKNVLCIQCRDYYKEFVRIKYERPTALYKWEEMYYYADFDWTILFKIPYKVV